jgi:hypothetical protein
MNSDATRRIDDIATDDTAAFSPTAMSLQQTPVNAVPAAIDADDDQLEVGAEPDGEDESDGEDEKEDEDQNEGEDEAETR